MTRTMTRPGLRLGAMALLGAVLLTGCGSGQDDTAADGSTETATQEPVTMAQALAQLYVPAGDDPQNQPEVGQCLEQAVNDAQISEKAQQLILDTDGSQDLGSVIQSMPDEDRDTMLSSDLRQSTDDCLLEITSGADASAAPSAAGASSTADDEPAGDETTAAKKPNTKPVVKIDEDQTIQDSGALRRGVISMFGSFAVDEHQKKVYERSADCFSQTIFGAGLSDDGLRFIAGGAPLGTGSIADHLNDGDRAIWESDGFTDQMVSCTDAAETELAAAPDDAATASASASSND